MANVILGAVALAILQGVVSRKQATANLGGFIANAGRAVEWFISPAVPAFKNAAASTGSTRGAALAAYASAPGSSSAPTGSAAPSTAPQTFSPYPGLSGMAAPFAASPQTQAQGGAV